MKDGTDRLILFYLHADGYALRLEDVAEVLEPPPLYPIPRAPRYFPGIMNFHGSLIPVIDLAGFLSKGSLSPQGQLLVLDNRIANLALWVDSVESVRSADVVLDEREVDEELVEKVLTISTREVRLLSAARLVDRVEEILAGIGNTHKIRA
jgi:purine-binding chemotaxis protein CheW